MKNIFGHRCIFIIWQILQMYIKVQVSNCNFSKGICPCSSVQTDTSNTISVSFTQKTTCSDIKHSAVYLVEMNNLSTGYLEQPSVKFLKNIFQTKFQFTWNSVSYKFQSFFPEHMDDNYLEYFHC